MDYTVYILTCADGTYYTATRRGAPKSITVHLERAHAIPRRGGR
jgi:predicted GIY-YIG superfamily endonuclease